MFACSELALYMDEWLKDRNIISNWNLTGQWIWQLFNKHFYILLQIIDI